MPPLNAAFALAQVNHFAVLVAEHLKLDMARKFEKLLHVNVGRAERLLRLASRRLIRSEQFFLFAHYAHTPPAAAGRGFQDQWVADALSFLGELLFSFHNAVAPGNRWQPGGLHFAARAVLLAHQLDDFRSRTDERNFRSLTDLRKVGVFGKKAVARMDGVHVGDFCRADYLRNVEITLAAARGPDADRFVGKAHMQRIAVRLGINRHGRNTQLFAGTDDPQGNFPSIGD